MKDIKFYFGISCGDCGYETSFFTHEDIRGDIIHCIKCGADNFRDFTVSEVNHFKHYTKE